MTCEHATIAPKQVGLEQHWYCVACGIRFSLQPKSDEPLVRRRDAAAIARQYKFNTTDVQAVLNAVASNIEAMPEWKGGE